MEPIIFCQKCGELLLDAQRCSTPNCDWERPDPLAMIGKPAWPPLSLAQRLDPLANPLLVGSLALVPTEDAELLALNLLERAVAWRYSLPQRVVMRAFTANRHHAFVCPSDADGLRRNAYPLVAIDLASGRPAWQAAEELRACSVPTLTEEGLFFSAADKQLRCVDPTSGATRWQQAHTGWGHAAPAADDELVVVGGMSDQLLARRASDGALLWHYRGEQWFDSQPLLLGELVVTVSGGKLYAFHRSDGSLRWLVQPERGDAFTSPPAAHTELIAIGSRVYQQQGDQRLATYALLALDPATGNERWRYLTSHKIVVRPLVVGDSVFALVDDGRCVALNAADGTVRWLAEGASDYYAPPAVLDDTLVLFGRDGTIHGIRWRLPDPLLAPAEHLARGEIAEAAAAYALAGDLLQAADLYANPLKRYQGAARLYARAGAYELAAAQWEAAEFPMRARDCYREAGNAPELARLQLQLGETLDAVRTYEQAGLFEEAAALLEKEGQPLAAARSYEQAGMLAKAALLFEEAGEPLTAARLYFRTGQRDKAEQIWQASGAWEQAAETLVDANELPAAAQLLEQHEQLERAAELYEQAERFTEALLARSQLGQWERVAYLALRLNDYERAAEAYKQLNETLRAANAYEQAARQLLGTNSFDRRLLASLFENAAALYRSIDDQNQAEICRTDAIRYGELPDLVLELNIHGDLVEMNWNRLLLRVRNNGYGAAYHLQVEIGGRFEFDREQVIETPRIVSPASEKPLSISVRPKPGEIGSSVPLVISIDYADQHQVIRHASQSFYLAVRSHQQGITPISQPTITPLLPHEVVLNLRFGRDGDDAQVIWEAPDHFEQVRSSFRSPYRGADLVLVNRALNSLQAPTDSFSPAELARLRNLGLQAVDNGSHRLVGRALHHALLEDRHAYSAFAQVQRVALSSGVPLDVRLHFADDPTAVELAALPWELLWGGGETPLLFANSRSPITLTRHFALPQPVPPTTPRQGPLTILVIAPHAGVEPEVRERERASREQSWRSLLASGQVLMEDISPATRNAIIKRLREKPQPDIIHFVGHGYYDNQSGYLILDSEEGNWDHVPVGKMAPWLSLARLVLLNACESASFGTSNLLTGVAPALSVAGAPAVVAMQLSVRIKAALQFSQVVYEELARGAALQHAVAEARLVLFSAGEDDASWYVPTLTLRTRESGPFYV
jgi:outer membrane protein assembly factor BamB/tetratricopeptide (TPR) repeat protein